MWLESYVPRSSGALREIRDETELYRRLSRFVAGPLAGRTQGDRLLCEKFHKAAIPAGIRQDQAPWGMNNTAGLVEPAGVAEGGKVPCR